MTLVERGGSARSFHIDGTSAADRLPIIKASVPPGTRVMTDEAGHYAHLSKHFAEHGFTRHGKGFYSLFKRGMKGVYQHCSEKHLRRYVAEFDFRYSNRIWMGVDDAARTQRALRGIVGKRLTYRDSSPKAV